MGMGVGIVGKLRKAIKKKKRKKEIPFVYVGRHSYGHDKAVLFKPSAAAPLKIGNFCSIANATVFLCDANHALNEVTTFPIRKILKNEAHEPGPKRGITVGHDVWIGYGATILGGVKISDGAIIGAGSVVTKDVEPYAIVAGNPARFIRYRFPKDVIDVLLRIKWWEWEDSKVIEASDLLAGPIEDFLDKYSIA